MVKINSAISHFLTIAVGDCRAAGASKEARQGVDGNPSVRLFDKLRPMSDPLTRFHYATWAIVATSTAGVILRPWKVPEAVWAVAGALALLMLGLLPDSDVLRAVGTGTDVYLFLIGMMLLAELARREGLSMQPRALPCSLRAARVPRCSRWSMRSASSSPC